VFLIAQVLSHLLAQSGLNHRLRELFEQPVRAGQRQALLLGQPDQIDRSRLFRRLLSILLLRHIIQCRRHQTPTLLAELPPGVSGRKHRFRAVPSAVMSRQVVGRIAMTHPLETTGGQPVPRDEHHPWRPVRPVPGVPLDCGTGEYDLEAFPVLGVGEVNVLRGRSIGQ